MQQTKKRDQSLFSRLARNTLCVLILLACGSFTMFSQDLHQTDYSLNPLLLNPAKTGSFHGTFRIGGVYRDQFRPFIDQPYSTPAAFGDSPVTYGFSKQHWVGGGLLFFSDQSGDLSYKTSGTLLSAAYHIGLDKDLNSVISIGGQYGRVTQSVEDGILAVFGDELADPNLSSPDRMRVDNFSQSYNDINAGVQFQTTLNDESGFQIGFSAMHLARPRNVRGLIEFRMNAHAIYSQDLTDRLTIEPTIYYYQTKTASAASLQANASYHVNPEKPFWLTGGLGYRTDDAIQFLIGANVNDWRFGIAYDLTISDAAEATQRFGAIEVGINRIIKIYKEPEVDPIIFCPRF